MAIDSRQKRMSAMNLGAPWRGPMIHAPEASLSRQAAAFYYSGIVAIEAPEYEEIVDMGIFTLMQTQADHFVMVATLADTMWITQTLSDEFKVH